MSDKGIIFSAPMVRALLDGRKTQTRRLLNPQPLEVTGRGRRVYADEDYIKSWREDCADDLPYAPGDKLYVREAYTVRGVYSDVVEVGYRAHENASHTEFVEQWSVETAIDAKGKRPIVTWPTYKPSIHMPRWASRLWLNVNDIRVQRLQDISEADAVAEGIFQPDRPEMGWAADPKDDAWWRSPREAFEVLWDSLHTKPGVTWCDNPWTVAVSFDVNRGNIDSADQP